MIPTNELFNHAWGHARRIMEKSKQQLQPLVYLHVKNGVLVAMPFKAREEDPVIMEDFMKDMIIHMIRAGIRSELIEGVVMPSEAWMSKVSLSSLSKAEREQVEKNPVRRASFFPRASQDPNRTECLILMVWGAEGRRMGFYEIQDHKIGKEINLNKEMKMETWIDKAFDMSVPVTPKDEACVNVLEMMIDRKESPEDMSEFFFRTIRHILKNVDQN